MTNTLNKIMHDGDEYLLPEGFSPDNAGTTDDVLTKTANGYEWLAPSGGDVSGPAGATDGHLAVFDGATGKKIKDGGAMPTIPTKVSDLTNDAGYLTSSTGVTSVNGSTGAVTVLESQTKVFPMPAVGDDISDLVSWLSAGKTAMLFAGDDTPGDRDGKYYQIYSFEESLGYITCEMASPGSNNILEYWIRYDTSTYIVQEKQQTVKLFVPTGGTAGQVLTQSSNESPYWATPSGGDVKYSDFEISTATSGATLTISDLTTEFVPTVDFTMSAGTVKEGMQYIVRLDSGATAYTLTLGTGITNPFGEDLTLTASKMTTVVLFATSSSALEVFSVRTAS